MHPALTRTFGGLERAYYFRQLLFGAIFPAIMFATLSRGGHLPFGVTIFLIANTCKPSINDASGG